VDELFPIAVGIVAGFVIQTRVPIRWKSLALILCSVIVGFLASLVSGELMVSWLFVIWDIAQVAIAAAITVGVTVWLQRRQSSR
jgi:hypothetical protein